MWPPPAATIAGITALLQMKVPLTLTSIVRRQASTGSSAIGDDVADARVVDQEVDLPVGAEDGLDRGADAALVGDVDGVGDRAGADLGRRRAGRVAVGVPDRDAGACRGEGARQLTPDPSRAAGDDPRFPRHPVGHSAPA